MTQSLSPQIKRRVAGEIAYRAPDGEAVGRERFELLSHAGGHVLRALCEIDETGLIRDVTLAMDPDWRPCDAFLRLTRTGEPLASLFFQVGEDAVTLVGTAERRPVVARLEKPSRLAYLGLHPLQGDALIVALRGTDRPGEFVTIHAATNSISPDGDEAPGLSAVTIDVAFKGDEMVTVAAGRFAARRYALRWREDWPIADLWVERDRPVFLKMTWPLVPTWYELIALTDLAPDEGVALPYSARVAG